MLSTVLSIDYKKKGLFWKKKLNCEWYDDILIINNCDIDFFVHTLTNKKFVGKSEIQHRDEICMSNSLAKRVKSPTPMGMRGGLRLNHYLR